MFRVFRVLRGAAAPQPVIRRKMGGGHAPPPEGGLDGIVRKYLPENHHVMRDIIHYLVVLLLISFHRLLWELLGYTLVYI